MEPEYFEVLSQWGQVPASHVNYLDFSCFTSKMDMNTTQVTGALRGRNEKACVLNKHWFCCIQWKVWTPPSPELHMTFMIPHFKTLYSYYPIWLSHNPFWGEESGDSERSTDLSKGHIARKKSSNWDPEPFPPHHPVPQLGGYSDTDVLPEDGRWRRGEIWKGEISRSSSLRDPTRSFQNGI